MADGNESFKTAANTDGMADCVNSFAVNTRRSSSPASQS